MNRIIEALMKRRSVRSYEDKPIPRDIMETIIKAANEAPSAMNSQPWRFVVVEDPDFKKTLLDAARPNALKTLDQVKEIDPERYEEIKKRYAEMPDPVYYSAPAVIFVIGNGRFAPLSCPLSCMNLMLAAYALGLGTCWVGFGAMVTGSPEVREALALGDDDSIYGPIVIGYPKTLPDRPPKNDAIIKWAPRENLCIE